MPGDRPGTRAGATHHGNAAAKASAAELRSLRLELSGADDAKVRRIAMLVDAANDPELNHALLDPIRARLAPLNPPRKLRLPRLLFMPFDPLIVPARNWQRDDSTVPRSALLPFSRMVTAALGQDEGAINRMIEDADAEQLEVIAEAGAVLWPRAAAIVAETGIPPNWNTGSGLPEAVFEPLARATATVWRRASQLRLLFRTGQIGALKAEPTAVEMILAGTPTESMLGCAMVARLILLQSPFAPRYVRLFASATGNGGDQVFLQKVITNAFDEVIKDMERPGAFAATIAHASLDQAADRLRNVMTLLLQTELDASSRIPGPRLKAVRENLTAACGDRISAGMKAEVLAPLTAAAGLLSGVEQTQIEAAARDLRMVESAARSLGDATDHNTVLEAGIHAAAAARHRGVLSRMGQIRLIEILAGPEAALRMYRR
ncbi:MAG: hypothetical protein ACJ8AW_13680 [Rhodopila sp.]